MHTLLCGKASCFSPCTGLLHSRFLLWKAHRLITNMCTFRDSATTYKELTGTHTDKVTKSNTKSLTVHKFVQARADVAFFSHKFCVCESLRNTSETLVSTAAILLLLPRTTCNLYNPQTHTATHSHANMLLVIH